MRTTNQWMPILPLIIAVSVLHGQDRPAVVEPVPGTLRKLVRSGERTQVFVLGTAHLNTLGDRFNSAALDGLVAILEKYRPQAIGVESLSGPQIAAFTQDYAFAPALKEFAKVKVEAGAKAQQALGQTASKAYRNAIALIGGPPKEIEKNRSRLVLELLAGYELDSAALQWSYLTAQERDEDTVVPRDLRGVLDQRLQSRNEIVTIGIRLARALTLQSLVWIDDHQAADAETKLLPRLVEAFKTNPVLSTAMKSTTLYADSGKLLRESFEKGDALPYYRDVNSLGFGAKDVDLQWGSFLRSKLADQIDRSHLALWEVRNLQIAANIRRLTADHPGGRVLVIIGAAHKPFLESYLQQMADIDVVRALGQ